MCLLILVEQILKTKILFLLKKKRIQMIIKIIYSPCTWKVIGCLR